MPRPRGTGRGSGVPALIRAIRTRRRRLGVRIAQRSTGAETPGRHGLLTRRDGRYRLATIPITSLPTAARTVAASAANVPGHDSCGRRLEAANTKAQQDRKERRMPKEYTSVVIDKTGIGIRNLQLAVVENGLQTAQMLGIQLSMGSIRLEHHLHVFMWDDSVAGVKGRRGIEQAGNCFVVRVRWTNLSETGTFFSGTLKGDGGHNGPPSGVSPNGAWAFKGAVPWQYCYVDDLDTPDLAGFGDWREFRGWPADQQTRHR